MHAAVSALVLLSSFLAGAAQAQDNATIAVPPAPLIVPSQPEAATPVPVPAAPPPGLVQTLSPLINSDAGQAGAPPPAAGQPAAPAPPGWLPGQTAKLGVLDKIDGSTSQVTIPVGGQQVIGDLQVNVLACVNRPADQVPDAAIFIAAQNAKDNTAPPLYRGWIIRSAPGAAVVGDASETFRVINCS